jgi:hypothetical protein
MPLGPPKTLERIVGWLLPPANREEVLGDLWEQYSGPGQYLFSALRVVPCVIASRILRTTDAQVLVIETSVLYGSYLASAWYRDPASLTHGRSLLLLTIPTAVIMSVILIERAWGPGRKLRNALFAGLTIGISVAFDRIGGLTGLLLVSGIESAFPSETMKLQSATGPMLSFSRGPAFMLKAIGGFALASLILKLAGFKPAVIFLYMAFVAIGLFRTRNG